MAKKKGNKSKKKTGKKKPAVPSFQNNESGANGFDEGRSVRRKQEADERKEDYEETAENLKFEDPFEDVFEDEEVEEQQEEGGEGDLMEEEDDDGVEESKQQVVKKVWLPGMTLDGEEGGISAEGNAAPGTEVELEYDPSAYVMYHSLRSEWPCLTFDIVPDTLGENRTRFPHTIFAVTGSQAESANQNKITLLKMSNLIKTQKSADDSDSDDDDDDDEDGTDDDPVLDSVGISHRGGINRIRVMPQKPSIVATWADTGRVHLWDLKGPLDTLGPHPGPGRAGPRQVAGQRVEVQEAFTGHPQEGFAMDWSSVQAGRLVTGDCGGYIYVWEMGELGRWDVNKVPFSGHTDSVEDLQWSPTEPSVFMSCSADRSVRVWDVRGRQGSAMLTVPDAHTQDVNVMSWNRNVTYLVVTGSDDGSFKIWDLRTFGSKSPVEPVAHFRWHRAPITSVEWHPTDESALAVAGADNQITVWDLSVEADDSSNLPLDSGIENLPPQLLFIHQGQKDIKELHFHRQVPGVLMSTALDGFNVFKPATEV